MPSDWILEGIDSKRLSSKHLSINNAGGLLTLRLVSSEKTFVFLRRTNASLLASPFLGWWWNVSPPLGRIAAIRLIIGFHGGNPKSRHWSSRTLVNLGTNIPPYDRVITIVWGAKPDSRGVLEKNYELPRYILRAGAKNAKTWLHENIDLSRLYRELWPNDNAVLAQIIFVGLASASSVTPTTAKFRDLVLYR